MSEIEIDKEKKEKDFQDSEVKENPNGRARKPKRNRNAPKETNFWLQIVLTVIVFAFFISMYSFASSYFKETEKISLSELARDVKDGLVSEINVSGDDLLAVYVKPEVVKEEKKDVEKKDADKDVAEEKIEKKSKKEGETGITESLENYGVPATAIAKVNITVKDPGGFKYWFGAIAPLLIPILAILGILWYLSRQMKGPGMQAFTFGQSRARMTAPDNDAQRVTFADVAGAKEAKEELSEIVDFLKSPKKFIQIGARIPKGVLLMGAPGVGKTILARAVAGEAGVPFFNISGSEFVEMFVGVGAARTRDLFDEAKKIAPAIIFIDEIDAVGRVRGSGFGGGNDEREQTLNQILVEMDGFEPNEKVIVMAASNRPDVLDPALLRPGRFDRRVIIDLPDRKDRLAILEVHARKKPFGPDVKLEVIAERTPGFSGADLSNLMNEGAILAARELRTEITQFDLIRSIEKVMLGPERKSHILSKKEKEITAYHEAGHALVASVLPFADPVHKISIISRGRAAGYTLKLPLEDRKMQSKKEFLDDIAVSIAGYVAEKMIFDDITTGPSNDLQVLTNLARNMVVRWGMSDTLGTVALAQGEVASDVDRRSYSNEVAAEIDAEVKKITDDARKRAQTILIKHRKTLNAIAERLIEVETIERADFEDLLREHGIVPKEKKDIEHSV